jgi:hypothetical protein
MQIIMWGLRFSHDDCDEHCLLESDAVQISRSLLPFHTNELPPSSELKSKPNYRMFMGQRIETREFYIYRVIAVLYRLWRERS